MKRRRYSEWKGKSMSPKHRKTTQREIEIKKLNEKVNDQTVRPFQNLINMSSLA